VWGSERPADFPDMRHSTPEDRVRAGHEIALFEDLEGLPESRLNEIMLECPVEPGDPDICVPDRAYAILMGRRKEAADRALHKLENPTGVPLTEAEDDNWSQDTAAEDLLEPLAMHSSLAESLPHPELGEDVRDVFIKQVTNLNATVQRMLNGPPIPPPNVTVSDLAALKIGAEEWVKHMHKIREEGFSLNSDHVRILTAVENVLRRMS
jgi:hypothetical protein